MKTLKTLALVFSIVTFFSSCSSDNNKSTPVIEEELITTVTAIYTPQGGGTAVTLESKDIDGDGPGAPTVTVSGAFAQNTTYNGVVTFKNESVNPAEDITIEIKELAEEHQVFYQKTGSLNNFTYATAADNFDTNGNPVGLQSVFTTTGATSGTLKITLVHLPNKTATGVSAGDLTNAGGSTDATAIFEISVE